MELKALKDNKDSKYDKIKEEFYSSFIFIQYITLSISLPLEYTQ